MDFVEVPLANGGALIVETVDEPTERVVRAGAVQKLANVASETFESAVTRMRLAAEAVGKEMATMDPPPTEVETEFAIKVGSAIGVVLASSTAEANLKVTVRWTMGEDR